MSSNFQLTQFDLTVFLAVFILTAILYYLVTMFKKTNTNNFPDNKLDKVYLALKQEIQTSVKPHFIDIKPDAKAMFDFAVEVWRIEQRLLKTKTSIPENQWQSLEHSVQQFKKYLEKYDVDIIDYTGKKYNTGMNVDVLSVEKNANSVEATIKETVAPTITHRGQIVLKAKVVVMQL